MWRPVAVLAVGKDQRVVVKPSGEGLAVSESGLAIVDLFSHHLNVHMPIILLLRKAPLEVSCQCLEFLKEMQSKGREEDMVFLLLARVPLTFSLGMNQVCWFRSTFFHSACSNWIKCIIAGAHMLRRSAPSNKPLERPIARGRIWFSIGLLSMGTAPSSALPSVLDCNLMHW